VPTFDDAFKSLIGNEGGYVDNPSDPGGETMYGVTKRVASQYGYTGSMKNLPLETAKSIAKKEYWDAHRCDEVPYQIAFQIFDTAYNGGYPDKWTQMAIGSRASGKLSDEDIQKINSMDIYKVVMLFNAYRLMYYTSLKKSFKVFGGGWANRIAHNMLLGSK